MPSISTVEVWTLLLPATKNPGGPKRLDTLVLKRSQRSLTWLEEHGPEGFRSMCSTCLKPGGISKSAGAIGLSSNCVTSVSLFGSVCFLPRPAACICLASKSSFAAVQIPFLVARYRRIQGFPLAAVQLPQTDRYVVAAPRERVGYTKLAS